jgi:Mg/Co/Ni transporter MgtE
MTVAPELLYLLTGDPAEFAEVVSTMQSADVAEALRALAPEAAARVIAALPFDLAVFVLDEPELENRLDIVRAMDVKTFGPTV